MAGTHQLEAQLARGLLEAHPEDAAAVLDALPEQQALAVLADVDAATGASVLRRTSMQRAAVVLELLPLEHACEIVAGMDVVMASHVLRRVALDRREALLGGMDEAVAHPLRRLASSREGTAGAMMDPHVLALPGDVTVAEAKRRIRASPAGVRYNVYVVDRAHKLIGVLTLRELMLAKDGEQLGEVGRREVLSIPADADRLAIMRHPAWRVAHAVPVVDDRGCYLGAVRYRILRDLERQSRDRTAGGVETGQALSELFWAGIAGTIGTMNAALGSTVGDGDEP